MFRRRITRVTPSEQLRDYIVRLLGSGEALPADCKIMAREIARHWRPDAKRERRIARFEKACAVDRQLAELLASDRTMTVAQAKKRLARDHGHNSAVSLDRWLRRNRDCP